MKETIENILENDAVVNNDATELVKASNGDLNWVDMDNIDVPTDSSSTGISPLVAGLIGVGVGVAGTVLFRFFKGRSRKSMLRKAEAAEQNNTEGDVVKK